MRRFKSMTKWMIAALAIFTLFTVFSVGVYAAKEESTDEVSVADQNYELLDNTKNRLYQLKIDNNAGDRETREIGDKVNLFLLQHRYEEKLYSIPSNYDMSDEKTADIIELYFAQIEAANEVAWIYFGNIGDLGDTVKADFDGIIGEIDATTNIKNLDDQLNSIGSSYGFRTRMYISIYTAKLNAMREESDSATATAIIDTAIEKLNHCTVNTNNSQYEQILADAIEAVGIQRNQDRTIGELGETFGILFGAGFESNEIYSAAVKDIDDDSTKTIAQMNELLLLSVKTALEGLKGDGGKYVIEYYDSLKAACDAEDTAGNTKIADLSSVFASYFIDLHRSKTKDEVRDHINGKACGSDSYLAELEKEYNSAGGILDGKMHVDAIDLEADRAMRLSDLYERLVQGIDEIEAEKGAGASVSEIKAAFDKGESAIKGAADGQALTKAFNEAMAAVAVEEYMAIYSAVVAIAPEKVTVADKADVAKAIDALNSLDTLAKADGRIVDAAEKLTELYKSIAKQEIGTALSGDGAHKDYADKLDKQIDALSSSGIATLIDDTARVVGKAKPMDSVLDRYGEIILSDDYSGFTDKEKQKLSTITTDACEAITGGAADASKVAEDAITALNRSEAISRVTSKQREGDGADLSAVEINIVKIVAAATEMINAETDADKIKDIADGAIFDIQKEFDVQSITDTVDSLTSKIDGLGYITEEEKQKAKTLLQTIKDVAVAELGLADSEQDVAAITSEAKKSIADAFDDLCAKNTAARAEQTSSAEGKLKEIYDGIIKQINDSLYLDGDDREALKAAAEAAFEDGKSAIASASDTNGINRAVSDAEGIFDQQKKEIDSQNSVARDELNDLASSALDGKKQEILATLKDLTYIGDGEKAETVAAVDAIISEAKSKLEDALSADEIRSIEAEATSALDAACGETVRKDLENAKKYALSQIGEHGQNTEDVIGSLFYTGRGQVEKLNKELSDLLEDAEEKIDLAESSPDVDAIRDDVLAALESMRADVIENEDDACVSIFAPIAATLGVIAIVEIVAIVLLDRKKKGMAASSGATAAAYAAIAPTMRTVPTVAWSGTLLLLIADIVMAVMIIRLIVQLIKLQAKPEEVAFAYAEGERAAQPQIDSWEDSESEIDKVFGSEPEYIPVSEPEIEEEPEIEAVVEEEPEIEPEVEEDPEIEAMAEPEPEAEAEVEEEPEVEPEVEEETKTESVVEVEEICEEPIGRVKAIKRLKIREAIVNVDQLEKSFEAGERVDMEALKDRGLISMGSRCVKVLARGEIYKPLHVVARRFSAAAKERIEKVGGRAECERD